MPFDPSNIPAEGLDSLDEVPEPFRGVFEPDAATGKFKLADLGGLKKNRDKALKEAKAHRDRLEALKAKGIDPDKFSELGIGDEAINLAELFQLKREKAEATAKKSGGESDPEFVIPPAILDKWRAERDRDIKAEKDKVKAAEDAVAKARNDLFSFKLKGTIRRAASEAGIIPADLEDALLLTEKYFRPAENDPEKLVVLDDEGDPTDMSLKKFWEEHYKTIKPKFYQSTDNGGSGASANQVTTGKLGGADFQKLAPVERLKAARKAATR